MIGRTNVDKIDEIWSDYELYYQGGNTEMPTLEITVPTKVMFVKQGFNAGNGYYYLNILQGDIRIPFHMFSSSFDGYADQAIYVQLEPGQKLAYQGRGGTIPNNAISVYISRMLQ